jgi:hypothetical protein
VIQYIIYAVVILFTLALLAFSILAPRRIQDPNSQGMRILIVVITMSWFLCILVWLLFLVNRSL